VCLESVAIELTKRISLIMTPQATDSSRQTPPLVRLPRTRISERVGVVPAIVLKRLRQPVHSLNVVFSHRPPPQGGWEDPRGSVSAAEGGAKTGNL
jgi:hypothetical protein